MGGSPTLALLAVTVVTSKTVLDYDRALIHNDWIRVQQEMVATTAAATAAAAPAAGETQLVFGLPRPLASKAA